MQPAICHYSFHRTWATGQWSVDSFAATVKDLGVQGIDFHTRLMGGRDNLVEEVTQAVQSHGLTLASLSFSNDFNQADREQFDRQVQQVKEWIRLAGRFKAPVARIFGGSLSRNSGEEQVKASTQRIMDGLAAVVPVAHDAGVILALENHGGLPCTAEEQVEVITRIGSPFLRATVDTGNYLQGGQEPHLAAAIAGPYAAYVHFKDCRKVPDDSSPHGYKPAACTLGEGDVNLQACADALKAAGYNGFAALEYEGPEEEMQGVRRSIEVLKQVLAD